MSRMPYDGPQGPTFIEGVDWKNTEEYMDKCLSAPSIWKDTPTATSKIVAAALIEGVDLVKTNTWATQCGSEARNTI